MRTEDIISIFIAVFIAFLIAVLMIESARTGIAGYVKTFATIIGAMIGVFGAYWISTKGKRDRDTEEQQRFIHSYIRDFCTIRNQMNYCFNVFDDLTNKKLSIHINEENKTNNHNDNNLDDMLIHFDKKTVDNFIIMHKNTTKIINNSQAIINIENMRNKIQIFNPEFYKILDQQIMHLHTSNQIFNHHNNHIDEKPEHSITSFYTLKEIVKFSPRESNFRNHCREFGFYTEEIKIKHNIITISNYKTDDELRIN
ncbi:hypothetical protein [uncultured Nisaea sp.]|uniref:hypothetical protein n=1 Tax=uncultured Nisaea sp. TaxID=538215 RepID=UPI0030EBBAD1